jgi:AP-4 complex subunit epsilon-1
MSTGGTNLSKEFFELLKAIGESKSKQEEDRIIIKEIQTLKKKLEAFPTVPGQPTAPNTLLNSKRRAKEFLVRLLYVEMLGHDASFGYIKALELTASASLYHKRTGYLVCGACLAPTHEFRFMLVNQMQRDLQSSHVLEICGGLLACTNIITGDMVPAVSGEVAKLLDHASENVRKKAVICLHRCHQIAPETVTQSDLIEKLRKVLCDRDPAVMGCSLNVIEAMATADAMPFKDLIPSLVSILKQICEHRLPTDFDYHRVPAPWMQLKLVRILGLLGHNDAAASSGIYEMLSETMKKADVGINAGYAIVYECIRTIVAIYPNATLLDAAGEAISRFIQSRSHNLKYLGVTGLAAIVETHPQYAAAHQMAVMDCLEDQDETLQRKTLDLLYRMTNPVNIEFITEKMLEFLRGTTDTFLKQVLTKRICSVAERYAPNNAWYIRTITDLFEISGDMVQQEVAQNLMSLIAEGTGESEEDDMLLRQNAIEMYVTLLKEKPAAKLPRILLETMAWCLGEYGYLSAISSLEEITEDMCNTVAKAKIHSSTRKFLVSAIMKLVAQAGTCPPHAAAVIDDFTKSQDVQLQQRCLEFQSLLTSAPHVLAQVLPVDASAEDVQVDVNLSFLDGYVQEALSSGASPYNKPEDDDDDDDLTMRGAAASKAPAFNMTPYEKPTKPTHNTGMLMRGVGSEVAVAGGVSLPPGAGYGSSGNPIATPGAALQANALQLNTRNVANVWGKGGLSTPTPGVASVPPSAAATAFESSAIGYPPATSSAYGGFGTPAPATSSYGAPVSSSTYGTPYGAPAPAPAEKTAEQIQKERMAAALFGGVIPGQAPRPPMGRPAPVAAPPPPPRPRVAAAPPPPAPEVDLLDMMTFDSIPVPAPAAAVALDIFAPQPLPAPAPAVETVSDDEEEVAVPEPSVPTVDPFANADLLGGLMDSPLASLSINSKKFEYNGNQLSPLPFTTPQFGQHWGTCSATSPLTVQSSSIGSLSQFMDTIAEIGAHKVESIGATNEGICAGQIGGNLVALIHGKVTPMGGNSAKLDVTVKSTDATMSGVLAMFLQNHLK